MITSFALEFESKEDLEKVFKELWIRKELTGEIEKLPLKDGRWRLNVHSEKQVRQSTIDGLLGKQVKVRPVIRPTDD